MARPALLIVDDEPDLLQVLMAVLPGAVPDLDVVSAATAHEALERLDAIEAAGGSVVGALVDHVLGGGADDGLVVIGAMKRRWPDAVAWLFTGRAGPAIEEQARQAGARVIWKPIGLQALIAEVKDAVKR